MFSAPLSPLCVFAFLVLVRSPWKTDLTPTSRDLTPTSLDLTPTSCDLTPFFQESNMDPQKTLLMCLSVFAAMLSFNSMIIAYLLAQSTPLLSPPPSSLKSSQALLRKLAPLYTPIRRRGKNKNRLQEYWMDEEYFYLDSGFTLEEFDKLHSMTVSTLCKPVYGDYLSARKLNTEEILLLVVIWLRRYYKLAVLGKKFGISESSASEYIAFFVPALAKRLRPEVEFPSQQRLEAMKGLIPDFSKTIGSFDLVTQQIHMPTADEWRFYRGDKGFFCDFQLNC